MNEEKDIIQEYKQWVKNKETGNIYQVSDQHFKKNRAQYDVPNQGERNKAKRDMIKKEQDNKRAFKELSTQYTAYVTASIKGLKGLSSIEEELPEGDARIKYGNIRNDYGYDEHFFIIQGGKMLGGKAYHPWDVEVDVSISELRRLIQSGQIEADDPMLQNKLLYYSSLNRNNKRKADIEKAKKDRKRGYKL